MKCLFGLVLLSAAPLLAQGLIPPADESRIYECTDAKGQVVYQDEPCPEAAPPLTKARVAPKPPLAPKHQAAPESPSASKPRRTKLPPALRSPEPPPSGHPVDARWATPQKTLDTFVGAVLAGDRALVLSCLTSSALAGLGPDAEMLPLEKLRETVSSFTGYVVEGDLGPFWSIRALRSGLRPKWIFFERTGTGEWKIVGI